MNKLKKNHVGKTFKYRNRYDNLCSATYKGNEINYSLGGMFALGERSDGSIIRIDWDRIIGFVN